MRTITEQQTFTHAQIEDALKWLAKSRIVGTMYVGTFHEQTITWDNGSATVTTSHTPNPLDIILVEPTKRKTR
jgi:hypothetical protein